MRKRSIALLLCAALLLALAGCGSPRPQTRADMREPEQSAPTTGGEEPAPNTELPPAPRSAEASFPLLARPFSDAESEAMANHNARRCALLVVNYYYCRCLYSDGSSALVRYEIVDNNLRHRSILTPDCPADFLCESEGRLYYLNADGLPESVGTDGGARRVELDAPCRSLQLLDGALYCLLADGTLLALRGGEKEALLAGCAWAFVSEQGVFYTADSDGRAHLFDPETRTDVTLTAEAALCPTLIGATLFYAADEADGRHLRALELSDGTQRRRRGSRRSPLPRPLTARRPYRARRTRIAASAAGSATGCARTSSSPPTARRWASSWCCRAAAPIRAWPRTTRRKSERKRHFPIDNPRARVIMTT